jgi:2'-deoxynucleoside 5'-phosphate N-hydrolase
MQVAAGKTVYISGALTDMDEDQRAKLRGFYEKLGEVCREFELEPYSPHVYADPKLVAHLTPEDVDRIDRLAVTQSYLVIAYIGIPSTGVGIEVELAHHAAKPVVLLFEKEKLEQKRITRIVRGNPAIVTEILFEDFDDAYDQLRTFLGKFQRNIRSESLPPPLSI